jgi:hypothetical protein
MSLRPTSRRPILTSISLAATNDTPTGIPTVLYKQRLWYLVFIIR